MYGCLTFLISALLTGAIGISDDNTVVYNISEHAVRACPTVLECRLRDYPWPTRARFTVRLRGVKPPRNPLALQSGREFFTQQLTTAQRIQLKNVHDHGYFVLTADVYADGRNLAEAMLEEGFVYVQGDAPVVAEEHWSAYSSDRWPPSDSDDQPALRPLPTNHSIPSDAADRPLSIRPETTLHDALAQLSAATRPQLPMLILWNDLEHHAFITRDTPVGVELQGRMRLGQALGLVLRSVSPAVQLVAQEDGGVLIIATRDGMGQQYRTGVYPVADIVSPSSQDRLESGDGLMQLP